MVKTPCYVVYNRFVPEKYLFIHDTKWDFVKAQFIDKVSSVQYKKVSDFSEALAWFKLKNSAITEDMIKKITITSQNEEKKLFYNEKIKKAVNEEKNIRCKKNLINEYKIIPLNKNCTNFAALCYEKKAVSMEVQVEEFNTNLCHRLNLPDDLCDIISCTEKIQYFTNSLKEMGYRDTKTLIINTKNVIHDTIKMLIEQKTNVNEKNIKEIEKISNFENYDGYENNDREFEKECFIYNILSNSIETSKFKTKNIKINNNIYRLKNEQCSNVVACGYETITVPQYMEIYKTEERSDWVSDIFMSDGGARPSFGGPGAFGVVHVHYQNNTEPQQVIKIEQKDNIDINTTKTKIKLQQNISKKCSPLVKCYGANLKSTSANRMEIFGLICTCLLMRKNNIKRAFYLTDSKYTLGILTSWLPNSWIPKGLLVPLYETKTETKKNKDLLLLLLTISDGLELLPLHIHGHAGFKYNELCDEICTQCLVNK